MSLLRELAGHPEYMRILKQADTMTPELPQWDVSANNVDEWKYKSAMREGFLLCLALFRPK